MNALTAISPIDGRYRSKVENLASYFSEYALIKYRVLVEIEYFINLTKENIDVLADFPTEKEAEFEGDLRKILRRRCNRN